MGPGPSAGCQLMALEDNSTTTRKLISRAVGKYFVVSEATSSGLFLSMSA